MCTIGYHKKLNLIFKNRDKNVTTNEVVIIKPDFMAVKTEGKEYYSLSINKYGCAFVSAAINTPEWISLASKGMIKEANIQSKKENENLVNPMIVVSKYLPEFDNMDKLLEILLNYNGNFMAYKVLLADKEKAVCVELYRKNYHIYNIEDSSVFTNHFLNLQHGPSTIEDYPSSFNRLKSANCKIQDAISIEDIFQMLKTKDDGQMNSNLWREGNFFTVSSTVIDLESNALYYCSDYKQDYARITAGIPPKGAEKVFIEMSRYIDLPTYHNIERGHPFYVEMTEEIKSQVKKQYEALQKRSNSDIKLNALELGAGTGLCTLELIEYLFMNLDALEIDDECCKILKEHPESSKYNVILGNALTYCRPHYYDIVVSAFAHDHIHYDQRFGFAQNIYNNLKKGGFYIMGGEFLPHFSNDLERKKALFKYHNYIIDLAIQHNKVQVAELENNALKSGLDMIGDFKRHEDMFEHEMASAKFKLVYKKKIGPLGKNDAGGVFVYAYLKHE